MIEVSENSLLCMRNARFKVAVTDNEKAAYDIGGIVLMAHAANCVVTITNKVDCGFHSVILDITSPYD